jgi:hypothetical protein
MATPPDFTVGQVLTAAQMNAVGLWKMTPTSVANATINADGSVSFTTQAAFSVNGCFTSDFANYKVVIVTTAVSANAGLLWRLRASGTDSSTGYYWGSNYVTSAGGSGISNGNNATSLNVAFAGTTFEEEGHIEIDVVGPRTTRRTTATFQDVRHDSTATVYRGGGLLHSVTTAYDGFTYSIASGNMTGIAYVYGYN